MSVSLTLPADRREAEARADALLREHRVTVAVVFPVVGAALLLASATLPLPDWLAFNGWLVLFGTAVMRSPLVVGLAPVADRRALAGVGLLAAYAYAVEYVGVHTGWPYGEFVYGVALGPTVAGVPLGLPVFFLPLVANAYLLCLLLLGGRAAHAPTRLATVVGLVLLMDVVLDPGAVALGFWAYPGVPNAGAAGVLAGTGFYGVPPSNYAGWVLSATVAVVALDRSFDRERLRRRLADCEFALDDMVSFVLLWGTVNVAFGNWLPALVAGGIAAGLVRADRFDASLLRPERS
ncbi:bisanhydrobacterioruberin hydratase [Candidatus Halobonum tyrrellensis]|uniref:Carotene biosynthesis associated membrane protein n=1 Tax=Candidatus Halobonum tyrrellensis G22 TaxID=1324957 RepID=V4HFR8_9EURY|nr:bisanhydrobacterioruberin hydratase [Candidatus Halobonum tyrrellensis]ESP88938.1 carotene biosynthesis associated membrane protein [Candidatus Halobonum tyrrellensis G22]